MSSSVSWRRTRTLKNGVYAGALGVPILITSMRCRPVAIAPTTLFSSVLDWGLGGSVLMGTRGGTPGYLTRGTRLR